MKLWLKTYQPLTDEYCGWHISQPVNHFSKERALTVHPGHHPVRIVENDAQHGKTGGSIDALKLIEFYSEEKENKPEDGDHVGLVENNLSKCFGPQLLLLLLWKSALSSHYVRV